MASKYVTPFNGFKTHVRISVGKHWMSRGEALRLAKAKVAQDSKEARNDAQERFRRLGI